MPNGKSKAAEKTTRLIPKGMMMGSQGRPMAGLATLYHGATLSRPGRIFRHPYRRKISTLTLDSCVVPRKIGLRGRGRGGGFGQFRRAPKPNDPGTVFARKAGNMTERRLTSEHIILHETEIAPFFAIMAEAPRVRQCHQTDKPRMTEYYAIYSIMKQRV